MALAQRWLAAAALGLATIGAYGTAYYAIGVLIPAIAEDTGWSRGVLAGSFSLGVAGQAGLAVLAGRLIDTRGSRVVLMPAMLLGAALLLLSSTTQTELQFVIVWAAGAAVIGAGLYYNVTMPLTARLYPENRATAFSILTLLGALASPIFYPVAGWLIETEGWRGAIQGLVALTVVCVAPAAVLVRTRPPKRSESGTSAVHLGSALARPEIHQLLLVMAIVAIANATLLLNQVPALQAAGLSLAAASGFAGARGAFQIPGRLLLTPLTSRLGIRGTIACCYGLAATATLALLLALRAGPETILIVYLTVAGGMSLGLLSPLNGLFQTEVFGDERLGTLSGVTVMVSSLATATGGVLSGLLLDLTGSYEVPLMLGLVCFAIAIPALHWQGVRVAEKVP